MFYPLCSWQQMSKAIAEIEQKENKFNWIFRKHFADSYCLLKFSVASFFICVHARKLENVSIKRFNLAGDSFRVRRSLMTVCALSSLRDQSSGRVKRHILLPFLLSHSLSQCSPLMGFFTSDFHSVDNCWILITFLLLILWDVMWVASSGNSIWNIFFMRH